MPLDLAFVSDFEIRIFRILVGLLYASPILNRTPQPPSRISFLDRGSFLRLIVTSVFRSVSAA